MSSLDRQEGGDHYKSMAIQPIEFVHKNQIPPIEASIIKYICRHKNKNGLEDLKKARHLIDILMEFEYNVQVMDDTIVVRNIDAQDSI